MYPVNINIGEPKNIFYLNFSCLVVLFKTVVTLLHQPNSTICLVTHIFDHQLQKYFLYLLYSQRYSTSKRLTFAKHLIFKKFSYLQEYQKQNIQGSPICIFLRYINYVRNFCLSSNLLDSGKFNIFKKRGNFYDIGLFKVQNNDNLDIIEIRKFECNFRTQYTYKNMKNIQIKKSLIDNKHTYYY